MDRLGRERDTSSSWSEGGQTKAEAERASSAAAGEEKEGIERPESIFIQRRDNSEAVIYIGVSYFIPVLRPSSHENYTKRSPFQVDFTSFMTVNGIEAGRGKVKCDFSIHKLIVRNLGNIQPQFSGWLVGWAGSTTQIPLGGHRLGCKLPWPH